MVPHPVHKRRRPKRLLSSLVFCGSCGGRYTVIGEDRFGCSRHRESGTCSNNRTIAVLKLENRILQGIKDRLLAPDMLAEFVEQVRLEVASHSRERRSRRHELEREMTHITARIETLVNAIENGLFSPALKARFQALESRRAAVEAELAATPDPGVIELMPNLPEVYQKKVENLRDVLNTDDATRRETIPILRSLIDRIVIHKCPGRGQVAIELVGTLTRLIGLAGSENANEADVMTMMVAEEGLEPPTRGL